MAVRGLTLETRLQRLVQRVPPPATPLEGRTAVLDLELSEVVPEVAASGFSDAYVVVRLHGEPLGTVRLDLSHGPVPWGVVEELVQLELGESVRHHLRRDGSDDVLGGSGRPGCREALAPGSPAPLVSVVVPTRNRPEQLACCLASLLELDYPAVEVVVVDNAPSDESTRSLVRERFGGHPQVRYVHQEQPGASLARNTGARASRGEFVAFTDDDAVVDPLWLSALVAGFRRDPRVVCVTGLTLPGALETPAQRAFEVYGGMGLGFEPRLYDRELHRGDTRLYPYTAGIFGASNNAAFRRSWFLDAGGFDVTLGPGTPAFGAEDLDLFLAVILDGDLLAYEPCAVVRHEHRAEFADLYWQVFTYSAGFTALLTKWAVTDRRVARDLARRVPGLLPAALWRSHRSGAEAGVGDYLPQLRWLERAGYLYGPLAYLRSRVATRAVRSL